jgi:Spy/CpxP family protein refolding chaperone
MKTLAKSTLAIIAALSLTSALAVGPGSDEGYGPGGKPMRGNPQQRMEMMWQHHTERMQKLQQQLNLQDKQKAAWQAFIDAQNTAHEAMRSAWQARQPGGTTPERTPERFDRMVQVMEQHLTDTKAVAEKAKDLYNILDDKQKSTLDQFFAKRPGFGHGTEGNN